MDVIEYPEDELLVIHFVEDGFLMVPVAKEDVVAKDVPVQG